MKITEEHAKLFEINVSKELYSIIYLSNVDSPLVHKFNALTDTELFYLLSGIRDSLTYKAQLEYDELKTFLGSFDDKDNWFIKLISWNQG